MLIHAVSSHCFFRFNFHLLQRGKKSATHLSIFCSWHLNCAVEEKKELKRFCLVLLTRSLYLSISYIQHARTVHTHYMSTPTRITLLIVQTLLFVLLLLLNWNGTTPLHHQMKSFPFCMRLKLDTVFSIVEVSKRWIRKTTAENILHSPFSHG